MAKKVGVLIFTDKIKERGKFRNGKVFDDNDFIGLNYIVSEINLTKYKIDYISKSQIDEVDFVLISLGSYYDVYNLVNELKGIKRKRSKIIVGGAGCLNIDLLRKYVDVVVLGRAEGRINDILAGCYLPNVWYKETDPNLESKYTIGEAKELISFPPKKYVESSVGCRYKCYFCQYGWENKFLEREKSDGYQSGYGNRENRFEFLDWNASAHYLISSIDGLSEKTRCTINKQLSNIQIVNKIREIYKATKNTFVLKLYCIGAYPWEEDVDFTELIETVKKVDIASDKKLYIMLFFTHFVPMPLTPMENEPVNLMDMRAILERRGGYIFRGKSIFVLTSFNTTSNISAIEESIVNRASFKDADLVEKILCSPKYRHLRRNQKLKVIQKYFPRELYLECEDVLPYVIRTYKTDKAKQRYYKLKKELIGYKND